MKIEGQCHCGTVRWRAEWDGTSYRCNCSLCRRKAAVMSSCDKADFELLAGENNLLTYKWNTGVAAHFYCKTCGIYTHHSRRTAPDTMGFNLACVDEVDPLTLDPVMLPGAELS